MRRVILCSLWVFCFAALHASAEEDVFRQPTGKRD
jgi:hypothetical protein